MKTFANCKKLGNVELNDGIKSIGAEAFLGTSIKTIRIPRTVEAIGQSAFFDCRNLKTVILNEGLKRIVQGAFENSSIESITFPGTVQWVGNDVKRSNINLF